MKTDQQMQAQRTYLQEGKPQTEITQKPGIARNTTPKTGNSPSALIISSTGKKREANMTQYLDNQHLKI